MWKRRASSNLRCRSRDARGPLGSAFILKYQYYKKNQKASNYFECENRIPLAKEPQVGRKGVFQGCGGSEITNVPKRLVPGKNLRTA